MCGSHLTTRFKVDRVITQRRLAVSGPSISLEGPRRTDRQMD